MKITNMKTRDCALLLLGMIAQWKGAVGDRAGNYGLIVYDESDESPPHDIGCVKAWGHVTFHVSIVPAGAVFTEVGQRQRTVEVDRIVVAVNSLYHETRYTLWSHPKLSGSHGTIDVKDIKKCLTGWFNTWMSERKTT